jgi:glucokinase
MADLILSQVDSCLNQAGLPRQMLAGVGCAAAGITDAEAGRVVSAANLPGWKDVPLASLLKDRFEVPAAVENDVRAAAVGEFQYGAGKGCRSIVYMTISTGVSAGIVIDGKVLRGHHNFAGEIAYLLSEPAHIGKDWGINGCLELTAAGVGIAREWASKSKHPVSAEDVFAAARERESDAIRLISRACDYLAQAAVALSIIIDPEVLILGGGIAANEPALVERIRGVVRTTLPYPPEVVLAGLGKDSPLIGSLALAAEKATF